MVRASFLILEMSHSDLLYTPRQNVDNKSDIWNPWDSFGAFLHNLCFLRLLGLFSLFFIFKNEYICYLSINHAINISATNIFVLRLLRFLRLFSLLRLLSLFIFKNEYICYISINHAINISATNVFVLSSSQLWKKGRGLL